MVLIISHRGASAVAPENTRIAFIKAIEHNADMIELDVQPTKDGELVVFHDDDLKRVTAIEGKLKKLLHADITKIKLLHPKHKNETILHLEEVLDLIGDFPLNIELKDGCLGHEKRLLEITKKHNILYSTIFSSFNRKILTNLRRLNKKIKLSSLCFVPHRLNIAFARKLNAVSINPSQRFVTKKAVDLAHKYGIKVYSFWADDEKVITYLVKKGVDGIITNHPHETRHIIEKKHHKSISILKKRAQQAKSILLETGFLDKGGVVVAENKHVKFPVLVNLSEEVKLSSIIKKCKVIDKKLPRIKKESSLDELLAVAGLDPSKIKKAHDIVGSIAIVETDNIPVRQAKAFAEQLLKTSKSIKTVLTKAGKHEGEFRTQKMKLLAGVDTREAVYKENNVKLNLNVENVYFSPRLSTERKRILDLVKPGQSVLVMFSGCAPYPIVISKNTNAKEIYAIELNPKAHKYAEENVKLNKANNVHLFLGDVNNIVPKLKKKFDHIFMPLPMGAADFLDVALNSAKEKGQIHFYDFLMEDEIPDKAISKIEKACKKTKKVSKILGHNRCGQFSPYKFRICVDFSVSNKKN